MDLATFINALISIRIPALGLNFIDILIIIEIIIDCKNFNNPYQYDEPSPK